MIDDSTLKEVSQFYEEAMKLYTRTKELYDKLEKDLQERAEIKDRARAMYDEVLDELYNRE